MGVDALAALAARMRDQPADDWPHVLLLLGDQVYADEVSPETAKFIRARRDVREAPGLEVEGFEDFKGLAYRVLFAEEGEEGQVCLALELFSEKSQKTPPRTIALAERRLRDWRSRGRDARR